MPVSILIPRRFIFAYFYIDNVAYFADYNERNDYYQSSHKVSAEFFCGAAAVLTFVSVFVLFKETEKSNEYLTANLHLEVEEQVEDIKAIISERDKLLQFVSHDMKSRSLPPLCCVIQLLNAKNTAQHFIYLY